MATFVLKKYEEKKDTSTNEENKEDSIENKKEITVTISGSISEIVANALNKVLANQASIAEIQESEDQVNPTVKTISTEDINSNPLETFNLIKKDDVVFIQNKGFTTSQEEWFLTNIPNKTSNVFYTLESFIKFIVNKLGISYEN